MFFHEADAAATHALCTPLFSMKSFLGYVEMPYYELSFVHCRTELCNLSGTFNRDVQALVLHQEHLAVLQTLCQLPVAQGQMTSTGDRPLLTSMTFHSSALPIMFFI